MADSRVLILCAYKIVLIGAKQKSFALKYSSADV